MADFPTRADLVAVAYDEIAARADEHPPGDRVSPDEVYTEGSDVNLMVAGQAAMSDELLRQLAVRIASLYLDSAEGEDLDRLVADRFSPTIVRKMASAAVVPVTFSRPSGPLLALTLPVGQRVQSDTGVFYELLIAAPFAAGGAGPITVPARALNAGVAGNADIGTITTIVSPPDSNLVVTNAEPAAGGDSTESDASLRARARDFFRTARRGTLAAIEFGALTVPGVRLATAIEQTDLLGFPIGIVDLYIADANGQANSLLSAAVSAALIEYKAAGVQVIVTGTTPVFVTIQYQLQFIAGIDTTLAFAQVRDATVSQVNLLRPNATLYESMLMQIARSVPGVIVPQNAVVAPVGDLVPLPGQTIRTRPDLVTAV
jgi:uncharacterized phage protein gp47/JayE